MYAHNTYTMSCTHTHTHTCNQHTHTQLTHHECTDSTSHSSSGSQHTLSCLWRTQEVQKGQQQQSEDED